MWSSRLIALDCHRRRRGPVPLYRPSSVSSSSSFGYFAPEECERLPTHHRQNRVGGHPLGWRDDQNQQSPIHFCLCRDIYHSDVIEISIHPVCCVPCSPRRLCLSFSSKKWPHRSRIGTWKREKRLRFRWEPKRFWQRKLLTKPGTIPVCLLSLFRPPFLSFFFFYGLSVTAGLHTKSWFISIRLQVFFYFF